jgi:hypothetical protein
MVRIGIVACVLAAAALGCGRGANVAERQAKTAVRQAPPSPGPLTAHVFSPDTGRPQGDEPSPDFPHFCQPDTGGLDREPIPLEGTFPTAGKPAVLYRDSLSLLEPPLRCVIRDKSDWTEIRILGRLRLNRSFKGVEFGSETVLLAGLGNRRTGGYDVRFDSVAVRNDTLFAFVGRSAPGPGSVLSADTTSPVEVLRVPRFDGPVVFVERIP